MVLASGAPPAEANPDSALSHAPSIIPEKYNDYNKSGLTAEVKSEPNTVNLDLK